MPGTLQEDRRLAALRRMNLLDTNPEERFDRLTLIAKRYYQVETVLFSLVDEHRQWFKSRQGLDLFETPREVAFCDYTIRQDAALIVEDASQDVRFRDNPLVTGEPHIRFYAGIQIREPTGFKVGTLCLIDSHPRCIGETELDVLRSLASLVEDELERAYLTDDDNSYVRSSQLGRSIHRAQNVFLTNDNEHAAFELMLNDLLTLTNSQFGFIGEVMHKSTGEPFLKIGAITNLAWSPETQALFQEVERRGMIFERTDTILARPMVTNKVIVSDNVLTDERGQGLPHGHPPINTYIGIPIHSGDRLIGLVGLANRMGGYTEKLASELEPLLQTVGTLIERKRLYQEKRDHQRSLEQAANYDALTGLPNRRLLSELFRKELHEANLRQGVVSVCFIDLDGFKEINDAHGHTVGDAVLKSVAQKLTGILRTDDVVARLGGDEFVAILRDVEDPEVYQRILDAIRKPMSFKQHVLQLSGSMGVALYPEDDSDPDLLLRHADQAMYAAKESGKNCYRLFDLDNHLSRKERLRVLEQIQVAFSEHQLELYYQPKIRFHDRSVEGFEGLIRWHHPSDGLLAPAHFLPHIEYTEFDRLLGQFVLAEAVATLRRFEANGLNYSVSVNLSPSHFLGEHFLDDLRDSLKGSSAALRSRLILEILETTALDDAQSVIDILAACRRIGVEVSLDDFGTGYSSLDYFRKLPADEIKIDRSFVTDMLGDSDDDLIVRAIISLCENFHRRTVAEGIETEALEARLIELGCEVGQGYYYSKPLPLEAAIDWADRYQTADATAPDAR
ncbi:MAG: EAL domain-containing protein [Marinobacter sp.]|nr:EAL domain-containing protein [Marinobacter sp.]